MRKGGTKVGTMWNAAMKTAPKAKKLAELLVTEAAKQWATMEELELAAKIATHAYERAMQSTALTEFFGEAKAAIDRL